MGMCEPIMEQSLMNISRQQDDADVEFSEVDSYRGSAKMEMSLSLFESLNSDFKDAEMSAIMVRSHKSNSASGSTVIFDAMKQKFRNFKDN